MKEILISYALDQLRSFRVNYIRSRFPGNEDPVHDYRVALKRIDATIRFLNKMHPGNNLRRIFRTTYLQHFFKQGGELREVHINQKIYRILEERSGFHFPLFMEFLRETRIRAYEQLLKSYCKYSPNRIIQFKDALDQEINELPEESIADGVDTFIENRISQIEALILDHHVESNLHKIRKYIKSIKYMLEMMDIQEKSYGKLNFTVDRITMLEDRIGDWHDLYVFKEDLSRFTGRLTLRVTRKGTYQSHVTQVNEEYRKMYEETVEFIYDEFQLDRPGQNHGS